MTAKKKPLRYFFLNGDLHKKLHINRGADEITAWNYPKARRYTYSYSSVRRYSEPAFNTSEVVKFISRGRERIEYAIITGAVPEPQYTYGLDENKNKFQHMWSEEDIMRLHAYFSSVHRGRPRNDGMITPQHLPTARELRAMIRQEEILYVKQGDKFVPTWKAEI
jgi:hypothetical protein